MPQYQSAMQARALRMKERPWWVCCYGVNPSFPNSRWLLQAPPAEFPRKWVLVGLKTFKTVHEAMCSRSFNQSYEPFSHGYALVVLRPRTIKNITIIREFALYEGDREWPIPKEFTFITQRTVTVIAENEDDAKIKVEAELHDTEHIITMEPPEEIEP